MTKKCPERVRLIIIDNQDTNRSEYINVGAASVISKLPNFLTSRLYTIFYIFTISIITLLIFFVLLQIQGNLIDQNIVGPKRATTPNFFAQLAFTNFRCGQMFQHKPTIRMGDSLTGNFENNFLFLQNGPLNDESACSLESTLKFSNRTIILMEANRNITAGRGFKRELQKSYSNLIEGPIDSWNMFYPANYYKLASVFGSNENFMALYVLGILSIWQYGGTIISGNLLKTEGNNFDHINTCLADKELLSSPFPCSAFVYEILSHIDSYKNEENSERLLMASKRDYCGKGNGRDCPGVKKVDFICSKPGDGCVFIRLDEWIKQDPELDGISHYCPVTYEFSKTLMDPGMFDNNLKNSTETANNSSCSTELTNQSQTENTSVSKDK